MKIKMLFDYRILFNKGAEVDVEEGEAKRLLSLGVAEEIKEEVFEEVKAETKKAVGRPKKKKED
jgi:hypothetical protein